MTYCTSATRRTETICRGNKVLRRLGVSPLPPGRSACKDAVKYNVFSAYLGARARMRGQPRDIPGWAQI
jgi:hypothetical protein